MEAALTGHFDDHHGLLCQLMLQRIDAVTATIDQVTAQIDRLIAADAHQVAQLDAIIGVGVVAAPQLIAELGSRWAASPLPRTRVSWAKFAPSTSSPPAPSNAAPPAGAIPGWPPPSARSSPRWRAPTPSPG